MPAARLAIMADDTNYGSLGALAPNWSDGERNIDTDEIYERFFEWVADVKGVEPWPHQEEAIMDLLAGDHVILNTPTGSGKSRYARAVARITRLRSRRWCLRNSLIWWRCSVVRTSA